jgi:hydrogenase maturation protein HypF
MADDSLPSNERLCIRLTISGTVQGVGFRPFVHRLAASLHLTGFVRNAPDGVVMEIEGSKPAVAEFERRLVDDAPAAASVTWTARSEISPSWTAEFGVIASALDDPCTTLPPPDRATCPECLAELFDPRSRYHRHAFIACATCGPRFSLIAAMPYDRERTAMADFPLCPACRREYDDPANRRFHAETTSCSACGPRLMLLASDGCPIHGDATHGAAQLLRAGRIVGVKGIGGYHLLVRADDAAAVMRLRERKRRPTKPFATLFLDIAAVEAACEMNTPERDALCSAAAPIVLLRRRHGARVADAVAPDNPRLGALLPYAPLHHLLLRDLAFPVVATSFNRTDELLTFRDDDAIAAAPGLCDALLTHDRAILRPVEDSVVQIAAREPMVLRLGRGFAPQAVRLRGDVPPLLALGGHLKNAPAITVAGQAVLAPQLGDLDDAAVLRAHRAMVRDLCQTHGVRPASVVRDAHPDYATTEEAEQSGARVICVQHHLAHVTAVMAEHALDGPVLGIGWDGTGYGEDGTVWGGEFLIVDGVRWRRFARLRPFRLPGGDAAAREPERAAVGVLAECFGHQVADLPPIVFAGMDRGRAQSLLSLCRSGTNAPWTSSAGRLIDAVAALLGICRRNSFEGEAAMALEALASCSPNHSLEPGNPSMNSHLGENDVFELDWRPVILALLRDLASRVSRANVAARFYTALIDGAASMAASSGLSDIVLTGGCFQSPLLAARMNEKLRTAGRNVYLHRCVPPGDGGLAVGQLEWARRMLAET